MSYLNLKRINNKISIYCIYYFYLIALNKSSNKKENLVLSILFSNLNNLT